MIGFWSFDFPETYTYILLIMYIPNTLHEENVHNDYVMGLIFSTSWRVAPKKKKFLTGIWIFGILYAKVSDPP